MTLVGKFILEFPSYGKTTGRMEWSGIGNQYSASICKFPQCRLLIGWECITNNRTAGPCVLEFLCGKSNGVHSLRRESITSSPNSNQSFFLTFQEKFKSIAPTHLIKAVLHLNVVCTLGEKAIVSINSLKSPSNGLLYV